MFSLLSVVGSRIASLLSCDVIPGTLMTGGLKPHLLSTHGGGSRSTAVR